MDNQHHYQHFALTSQLPPGTRAGDPALKAVLDSMAESFQAYYDLHKSKGCERTRYGPHETRLHHHFPEKDDVEVVVSAKLYCECYKHTIDDIVVQ